VTTGDRLEVQRKPDQRPANELPRQPYIRRKFAATFLRVPYAGFQWQEGNAQVLSPNLIVDLSLVAGVATLAACYVARVIG
jgi:hypothetical protein